MSRFHPRGKSLPLSLSPTHTARLRGAKQNPRGECHTKKVNLLQRSRHPHTSTFHSRTCPRLAHSSGASRAYLYLRSLSRFDSRATHARTLLPAALASSVPFGLYESEFEFEIELTLPAAVLSINAARLISLPWPRCMIHESKKWLIVRTCV